MPTTTGKLLIATPAIGDGTFEQSVIYMLHHDTDGALGVIINQPSELDVAELLPRWGDQATTPGVIFNGGPVEPNGFIGVGRPGPSYDPADQAENTSVIEGTNVVTVDLESDPVLTGVHLDALRIFRGYAGWGAHQLDTELAAGGWFTVQSEPQDMWTDQPGSLYEQVLLRQRGEMRWFANAPTDPSLN